MAKVIKEPAKTMLHWNGNQLCAIDTETTGDDPLIHEIYQLSIIPLTADIEVRNDVMPFCIEMKPERLDAIDFTVTNIGKAKERILKAIDRGFDQEKAKDFLFDWIEKLKLPTTESGVPKQIIPLGHNYIQFDLPFLRAWLGEFTYKSIFHFMPRDTMIAALYANDRAAMHAEKVPYSKVSLSWLCAQYKIINAEPHTALADAKACADVYKKMISTGLMG